VAALTSRLLLALALLGAPRAGVAAVLHVPEDRPSVAAALATAAPGDTVLLSSGTYFESVTLPAGVTLRGADPSQPPVLDAGGAARVVTSAHGSPFSRLEAITLRGGSAGTGPGGGVRVLGGNLALTDVTVENGQAAFGGALSLEVGAHVTWTRGTISGCSATYGGAVFADGGALSLTQVSFVNNGAQGGGAVYAQNANPVTLVSCSLSGNQSTLDGGALAFSQCGVSLSDCKLDGNRAGENGGALWAGPGTDAVCGFCVFSNNQALAGGAAYVNCDGAAGADCAAVHFAHADLVRNVAGSSSGAVGADGASLVEAQACVVAFNGGGITCLDSRATVDIACSLLHSNGPEPGSDCAGSVSDTTSADPLLCNVAAGDFGRCAGSPALAPAACGTPFLGAQGESCAACASTRTITTTWGGLKGRYR
jgi:predicted outer membrane repeat protein